MITRIGFSWFRLTAWGYGEIQPPTWRAVRLVDKRWPTSRGWWSP